MEENICIAYIWWYTGIQNNHNSIIKWQPNKKIYEWSIVKLKPYWYTIIHPLGWLKLKTGYSKCYQGSEAKGALICYRWECKMVYIEKSLAVAYNIKYILISNFIPRYILKRNESIYSH